MKQWIPQPDHSKTKNEIRKQDTETTTTESNNPNHSTKEKVGHIHVPQPTNKKDNQSIQTYRIENSPTYHKHNISTTGQKTRYKQSQWNI
jgi:hypothetical protein